jgi:hypothetical protein
MYDDDETAAAAVALANTLRAKMERIRMLETLLHAVVERTGNTREGYFSLRRLNELGYSALSFRTVEEYFQHLDNIAATVQTEVDRLEMLG